MIEHRITNLHNYKSVAMLCVCGKALKTIGCLCSCRASISLSSEYVAETETLQHIRSIVLLFILKSRGSSTIVVCRKHRRNGDRTAKREANFAAPQQHINKIAWRVACICTHRTTSRKQTESTANSTYCSVTAFVAHVACVSRCVVSTDDCTPLRTPNSLLCYKRTHNKVECVSTCILQFPPHFVFAMRSKRKTRSHVAKAEYKTPASTSDREGGEVEAK